MNRLHRSYQVVIVGGGPVGLFLAIALRHNDIECLVLEKRSERITHSRSLGIHPVSLELMQELGLADRFIEEGIKVKKGIAWTDSGKIGTLSFEHCPPPYRFVLTLPQYRTEAILEQALLELDSDCLVRGAELLGFEEHDDRIEANFLAEGEQRTISSSFIVGCDGKNSTARQAAGFAFDGKRYPDTYVMGDFTDHTELGDTAGIFLHSDGLIESFPLLEDQRRWVVKTDGFIQDPGRQAVEDRILERIGYDLRSMENFMLSSFGVQRYLANPIGHGRVFLAGDAAHIVSPIGGQGMNLGWLDAWELAQELQQLLDNKAADYRSLANQYSSSRRKAAKKAIRRAELNMILGRKSSFPYLKNSLVWFMLNTPLERLMARNFTMRGI